MSVCLRAGWEMVFRVLLCSGRSFFFLLLSDAESAISGRRTPPITLYRMHSCGVRQSKSHRRKAPPHSLCYLWNKSQRRTDELASLSLRLGRPKPARRMGPALSGGRTFAPSASARRTGGLTSFSVFTPDQTRAAHERYDLVSLRLGGPNPAGARSLFYGECNECNTTTEKGLEPQCYVPKPDPTT